MAKLTTQLNGNFNAILQRLVQGVLDASISATLEHSWDTQGANARCSVRVFERYSYWGGNRVSMSLTLFQAGDGPVELCAVTSGGSQAVFWKVNTVGEENFLNTLQKLLE